MKQEDSTYTISFSPTAESAKRYLVQTIAQRTSPASISIAKNEGKIRSASNGADYIIITHDDFQLAAQELAGYRAGQGLRTRVIPIQEIYDQFSFGLPEPEAMQAFIAHAFQNWQPPAPLHILLLGDGHLDYKNSLKRNNANFILPLLSDVDPWVGETAVDNRLVAVHGNDIFPDLYIGRLPVRTPGEAAAAVKKIKDYESQEPEAWNRQTVFVADNLDDGGDFAASNDTLSALLLENYSVNKVNYLDSLTTPNLAFKSSILSNLNAGRGLVVYSGHGSTQFWADEVLFHRKDIALLNPSASPSWKYSFLVTLNCMNGYFVSPSTATVDTSSIAEAFVRAPDRGAIAAFSPAGWGLVEGHDILATGLFEAIFTHGLNRAGADADGVILSLPLSDPFTQPEFTLPAGWVEQPGPALTWSIPALPTGAQGTLTGRLRLAPTAGGDRTLAVSIASLTPDTNPGDNSTSLVISSRYRYWLPILISAAHPHWLPFMSIAP